MIYFAGNARLKILSFATILAQRRNVLVISESAELSLEKEMAESSEFRWAVRVRQAVKLIKSRISYILINGKSFNLGFL
jgi:hypothetical protein